MPTSKSKKSKSCGPRTSNKRRLTPECRARQTEDSRRATLAYQVSTGAKAVVMEGLNFNPDVMGDWSGVAMTADYALRLGYEDIRRCGGPVPMGPISDWEIVEHDTHFEFCAKRKAA